MNSSLNVKIIGRGKAAARQETIFASLPGWKVVDRYSEADVISVANVHADHGFQVMSALEMRKHVIVEKPMCSSIYEADQIMDLSYRACVEDRVVDHEHTVLFPGELN